MNPAIGLLVLAILVFDDATVRAQRQDIVDKFRKCNTNDGLRLNDCVTDLWNDVRPRLVAGIPELSLAPIDPLIITKMELPARGLVQGKAAFENMTVTGLRNYEVLATDVDRVGKQIVIDMFVPTLTIEGKYILDADVFSLPIKGSGLFVVKLTDVDNAVRMAVDRDRAPPATATNSDSTLKLNKLDVAFDTKNITFRLDNLFGGGDVGVIVNKLVNANGRLLLESIKPTLIDKLREALFDIAAVVVALIPADILN